MHAVEWSAVLSTRNNEPATPSPPGRPATSDEEAVCDALERGGVSEVAKLIAEARMGQEKTTELPAASAAGMLPRGAAGSEGRGSGKGAPSGNGPDQTDSALLTSDVSPADAFWEEIDAYRDAIKAVLVTSEPITGEARETVDGAAMMRLRRFFHAKDPLEPRTAKESPVDETPMFSAATVGEMCLRARNEAIEEAAKEAERQIIEYEEIDILDKTPERLRIARRIRALRMADVSPPKGGTEK